VVIPLIREICLGAGKMHESQALLYIVFFILWAVLMPQLTSKFISLSDVIFLPVGLAVIL